MLMLGVTGLPIQHIVQIMLVTSLLQDYNKCRCSDKQFQVSLLQYIEHGMFACSMVRHPLLFNSRSSDIPAQVPFDDI